MIALAIAGGVLAGVVGTLVYVAIKFARGFHW